jgi:hypothetical protein
LRRKGRPSPPPNPSSSKTSGGGAAPRRDAERARGPRRWLVVGVVHAQAPSAQLECVEAPDGIRGACRVRELREREAAWPPGDAIRAEAHAHARIDVDEHRAQLVLRGLEGKIADEDRGRNGRLLGIDFART